MVIDWDSDGLDRRDTSKVTVYNTEESCNLKMSNTVISVALLCLMCLIERSSLADIMTASPPYLTLSPLEKAGLSASGTLIDWSLIF